MVATVRAPTIDFRTTVCGIPILSHCSILPQLQLPPGRHPEQQRQRMLLDLCHAHATVRRAAHRRTAHVLRAHHSRPAPHAPIRQPPAALLPRAGLAPAQHLTGALPQRR